MVAALKGKFAIFYLWFKYVHYDKIYIFTKFYRYMSSNKGEIQQLMKNY